MENQHFWKAKTSLILYLLLLAAILLGSIITAAVLLGIGVDLQNLTFPSALLSLPINEGLLLVITLIFAKENGANLTKLGLKKPNLKTLVIASFVALFLLLLAMGISIIEEIILGPDPDAQLIIDAILPRNLLQLIALISISIALVGPTEELAFRGFVQRGFETSFGKTTGLIIASILFGLLHGLNSLRSIIPVTIISLFLGYVWQKTNGNTTAVAWIHGIYDAITIALVYFAYL
ncbi:MAG: CPBP family intramembrane metalloprotease [Candidatus Bathyarchaeota archaeon]|nr:CPBP family intramembrane metalloprotease [Candidatus Bathyarchaeum sp.]